MSISPQVIKKWLIKAKRAQMKITPIDIGNSSANISVHLTRMWRVRGPNGLPHICYSIEELIAYITGYLSGVKSRSEGDNGSASST